MTRAVRVATIEGKAGPDELVGTSGRDGEGGDVLNGGPGQDGYNLDHGDTRVNLGYLQDLPKVCGGWDWKGPLPR